MPIQIQREGKPMQLNLALEHRPANDYVIPPYNIDRAPLYYILGGLVFQELSRQYLREWGANWLKDAPQRFVYKDRFQSELYPEGNRRVVVLTQVLPANSTIGYDDMAYLTVTKVNGKEVKSLAELAEAVKQPMDGFIKIETEEDPKQLELDAAQVEAEAAALQQNYGLPSLAAARSRSGRRFALAANDSESTLRTRISASPRAEIRSSSERYQRSYPFALRCTWSGMISGGIFPSPSRNSAPISAKRILRAIVEPLNLVVHGRDRSADAAIFLVARQNSEKQHLAFGARFRIKATIFSIPHAVHSGFSSGKVEDVIGADQNDDDLRGDRVQFAVLEAPEKMLGAIAFYPEVSRFVACELLPTAFPHPRPPVGDRIAQEDEIDPALPRSFQKLRMTLGIFRDRRDRIVGRSRFLTGYPLKMGGDLAVAFGNGENGAQQQNGAGTSADRPRHLPARRGRDHAAGSR